jgi:hypothetical protein
MIALRRPSHELAAPKRFVALENPLMFATAHYPIVIAETCRKPAGFIRLGPLNGRFEPKQGIVNIHNNGIWLPDAVNAILNLTALFRFLMHQKPFRPRYSE